MKNSSACAFFDLDGTILNASSAALWMKRERRLGRLSGFQAIKGGYYLTLYKIRELDVAEMMRKALSTVKGEEESRLAEWIRRWFLDEVKRYVSDSAREAIEFHRQRGHRLVLATSVSKYESEEVVNELEMDDYLCTLYEVADGRLTGEPIVPICYGVGKMEKAVEYCEAQGLDMAASYFYSDSFTDLPLLEKVGHPRIVNPDVRLRLTAFSRKWPVLLWR